MDDRVFERMEHDFIVGYARIIQHARFAYFGFKFGRWHEHNLVGDCVYF